MDAYTLVPVETRRNMEGMLKTWKEPVPGALDSTPVFPADIVRPIENALIKYRTIMVQNSRPVQNQPQQPVYRNTPTPPQPNGRYAAAPSNSQAQPYYAQVTQQVCSNSRMHPVSPDLSADRSQPSNYQPHTFSPVPSFQQPQAFPTPDPRPVNDVESVKRDVTAVIAQRQAHFAADVYNESLQRELNALLQLQTLLNTQTLDATALQQVRNQISALAAAALPPQRPTPQPASVQPQWQLPSVSQGPPQHTSRPPVSYSQPPSVQPQQASAPFLDPSALSSLQALLANGQKPSTPQMRAAAPALQDASHAQLSNVQSQTASLPAVNGADLIASLSRNGLLPPAKPTPPVQQQTPQPQSQPQQSTASLLQALSAANLFSTPAPSTPPTTIVSTVKERILPNPSSLKTFRPQLIHALYTALPNQCSTCGRRFPADDLGREKKARHLDWHFRTNQRMADSSIARGAHRDWFVNEMDWVRTIEFDPSTSTGAEGTGPERGTDGSKGKATDAANTAQTPFVRAPAGVTRNVCQICFEEMKTSYSENLQDWVFNDATMYGGQIVHANCLREMQKGQSAAVQKGMGGGRSLAAALGGQQGGGMRRSATPESGSSLGKRKAEGALPGFGGGTRMRVD